MIFNGKAQKGIKCSLKKKLCFIKLLQICFLKKYIFQIVFLKTLFFNTLSKLLSRKIHFKNYFLKKKHFQNFSLKKHFPNCSVKKKTFSKLLSQKTFSNLLSQKIYFQNFSLKNTFS